MHCVCSRIYLLSTESIIKNIYNRTIHQKTMGHRGHAISSYRRWSCEFESRSWWGVLDTTLCDKVCQWLATSLWFSLGTPAFSTNKTDRHDITEILLKVSLNTIALTQKTLFSNNYILMQINNFQIRNTFWK